MCVPKLDSKVKEIIAVFWGNANLNPPKVKPNIVTPVLKIPLRKGTNPHTRFANKIEHCFNLSQLKVTPNSKTDREESTWV